MKTCEICQKNRAVLKRPKTAEMICKECFFQALEDEVHKTITDNNLFVRGERIAIAASGGKDSTVLAHLMTLLNQRHDYGLELFLLSIDEGITGYRDDSLETVKKNQEEYQIPLKILSYKDLYGWSMDEIVSVPFVVFFDDRHWIGGATLLRAEKIVTGHNADDIAETVLMNMLRGDTPRLARCVDIMTGTTGTLPRCKPFKYTYEKEIVMYAYFKKLEYFSTECIYSPNAYRGFARGFLKDLERIRPSSILDIIHSGETMRLSKETVTQHRKVGSCERCGYISSQKYCKACVLLEGLNKGLPRLAIGKGDDNELTKENEQQDKANRKEHERRSGKGKEKEEKEKAAEKESDEREKFDPDTMGDKLRAELKKVFDV